MDGKPAALFYLTDLRRSCHLANFELKASNFFAAYNPHNAFFSPEGVLTLRMEGTEGVRLHSNDGNHQYGMYQIAAKISSASGVVTAFYLRNDRQNDPSYYQHDEIDFEFLNGKPAPPRSLWLNTFKNGMSYGTKMLTPGDYQRSLGSSCTTEDWMVYTINWQEGFVSWLVNGQNLYQLNQGLVYGESEQPLPPFSTPEKPSHVNLAIWTANGGFDNFGGTLDRSEPVHLSSFKELRRILCDEQPSEPLPPWLKGDDRAQP
jgi:beta-glucanase (GH16 family)